MEKLIVEGGATLSGAITVSGSKNAALPILAACLLTREKCVIRRVPDVSDTNYMVQIISQLGGSVERASGTVTVKAETVSPEAPYEIVRKMRASVCMMGPLLARLGQTRVSLPGGCVIGDRPVDLHLRGFEAMGAEVQIDGGYMNIHVGRRLKGREINLRGKNGPTVLGTANILMAAVLAEGRTVIESAACEPEIVNLAKMLSAMGARIEGAGTRRITIDGVDELGGVEHTVIPDRIEAGTFLVAGAIAGRDLLVRRLNREHVAAVTALLRSCGHDLRETAEDGIVVSRGSSPRGARITTEPYPGFPTDMQAQMTALLVTTPGISTVTDTVFPERFMHLPELTRMGAKLERDGHSALIEGVPELSGAPVMASDLRASAALVLAGLRARGITEINRLYHIDRGYEHIDEKLAAVGARIRRERA